MFIIAQEDVGKLKVTVCKAISFLNDGASRVDLDVELGDETKPLRVIGYWVGDIIRLDIKATEQ